MLLIFAVAMIQATPLPPLPPRLSAIPTAFETAVNSANSNSIRSIVSPEIKVLEEGRVVAGNLSELLARVSADKDKVNFHIQAYVSNGVRMTTLENVASTRVLPYARVGTFTIDTQGKITSIVYQNIEGGMVTLLGPRR